MARMELPVVEKFCFIFQLKTGCMAIGVISSLVTFVQAVILITFAVDINEASDTKGDEKDNMSSVVYTIVILLLILLFIKFLLDLIFVYAVYKEKSSIIKKYYIFWIVFLVLFIISFLKTLFHMGAGHVITQLFFLAANFYFLVIIRSYCLSINEDGVH
ncbi:uncharacterized protein LOC123712037 [Pieris brassicae]|uniref:Uncharacterized protein n=1 Tax=Pieris brassicae TaxID=7116 RepID=A0A9P0TG24_PIEBR|nr:uncharacterized protein LOC123712037 [Pieris brassicae]CAH4031681.1 unnamed protein product [Pieris brassicae]